MNPCNCPKVMAMTLTIALSTLPWHAGAAQAQDEPVVQESVVPETVEAVEGQQARRAFSDGVRQGKLETALMFSERLSPFKIATEVHGSHAVLTGEVARDVEKELAGVIAQGVDGIEQVDNRLVVDRAATRRDPETDQGLRGWVQDAGITAEVKAEFFANREINQYTIDISTKRGVVTLEGEVESRIAKDLAEQIVLRAERVNGVKNRLRIEDS